jgi:tetratricopeptide (TPR) repeat protein
MGSVSEMKPLETKGELSGGVLLPLFRRLHLEDKTGFLSLRHGPDEASICFIHGKIAWGHANMKECRLGPVLLRAGRISEWDHDQAAEMVAVTGRRFGQVLLDMGLIDQAALDDALALHVRELLLTVFSWNEGTWYFEERLPGDLGGFDRPLRISTAEVILDAVWSIGNPDVIRFALGDLDRALAVSADYGTRAQHIVLSPEDGFLFSRVDGFLTARQLLAITPVERSEAERRLLGLLCVGILEYAAVKSPRKAARAPVAPTPAPVPARPAARAPGPVRPTPRAAAAPAPPEPPAAEEPVPLDEIVVGAERMYGEGRYWESLAAVDEALPLASGKLLTRMRLLRARVYLKDPERGKDAERELRQILERDATAADAHHLLGVLAKRAGAGKRAAALFRRTLELNPRHAGAAAEMAELAAEEAPGGAAPQGLLQRFLSGKRPA